MEAAMASSKQKAAARKNIKKAAREAKRQKTISKLPKKTRTALGLLASALLAGTTLPAQVARRPATADVAHEPLDTAAILASARPEIDAANAAWLPGLQHRDAGAIAAAYADSGLFIAGDGTVTRGRAAVARMYAARFPRLPAIRAGGVIQDGL